MVWFAQKDLSTVLLWRIWANPIGYLAPLLSLLLSPGFLPVFDPAAVTISPALGEGFSALAESSDAPRVYIEPYLRDGVPTALVQALVDHRIVG